MKTFILIMSLLCCACNNQPLRFDFSTSAECATHQGGGVECIDEYSANFSLLGIIPQIKQGMDVNAVNELMAGRKPNLRYTLPKHNNSIWEFDEHINMNDNAISEHRLLIDFNTQGKVQHTISSSCLLPDLEAPHNLSSVSNCYERRLFPFDARVVYDAVGQLLIMSNYQIEHSDVDSLIISAVGVQNIDDDKDKVMFIKLTTIFRAKPDGTEVIISANFNISEKQAIWVQAGFAGVTLPIPLPFQEKEEWIYTGVVTPRFYSNFYNTLSALIAREFLVYKDTETPAIATASVPLPHPNKTPVSTRSTVQHADNSIPLVQATPMTTVSTAKQLPEQMTPQNNENMFLPKFEGRRDNGRNIQQLYAEEVRNIRQVSYSDGNRLLNLHGQAMDSEKVLKRILKHEQERW